MNEKDFEKYIESKDIELLEEWLNKENRVLHGIILKYIIVLESEGLYETNVVARDLKNLLSLSFDEEDLLKKGKERDKVEGLDITGLGVCYL